MMFKKWILNGLMCGPLWWRGNSTLVDEILRHQVYVVCGLVVGLFLLHGILRLRFCGYGFTDVPAGCGGNYLWIFFTDLFSQCLPSGYQRLSFREVCRVVSAVIFLRNSVKLMSTGIGYV